MRIGMHFPLIHQALLMVVEELNRILDGDHVLFAFVVDLVEHGGERGRFAGTGRTRYQNQAARLVAQTFDDSRQAERVESLQFPGNCSKNGADGAALIEKIAAEPRQIFESKGKVQLQVLDRKST